MAVNYELFLDAHDQDDTKLADVGLVHPPAVSDSTHYIWIIVVLSGLAVVAGLGICLKKFGICKSSPYRRDPYATEL